LLLHHSGGERAAFARARGVARAPRLPGVAARTRPLSAAMAEVQEESSIMENRPSAENKIAESIASKGENSYYFAHAKQKYDLSQAKRIEGDGSRMLAADGMKKLTSAETIELQRKIKWREDYAWGDDGGKVKIYVDFPEGSLGKDCKVDTNFSELKFEVVVHGVGDNPQGVTNGEHPLSGKIIPEKCTWRINSSKSRLTISLVKNESEESGAWSTLKKHQISKHTGWQ